MKIIKVLNNNAVIIMDEGQEKIAIGSGIGFDKGKNDIVQMPKVEKLFVLKENEKLQQLLLRIPEEHLILTEDIIRYAETYLESKLNDHILLVLTDHISFAIEREREGIHLQNKLLQEIKILYKKEFEVGLWALSKIKEETQMDMPIDEAAFIALHLHTMKMKDGDLRKTVKQTTIVRDMVETIKDVLKMEMKPEDIAYERLITHLRFALLRASEYDVHSMDKDILKMIKKKYKISFQCAKQVAKTLPDKHEVDLPEDELGYITLHIERLRKYN